MSVKDGWKNEEVAMYKVPLSDLHEFPNNPRWMPKPNFERLQKSIKTYTKTIPEEDRGDGYRLVENITVNINGNRIVCGHQRVRALKTLGQDWIHKNDITWIDVEPDGDYETTLNIVDNSDDFSGSWDRRKLDAILSQISENTELFSELGFPEIKKDERIEKMREEEDTTQSEDESEKDEKKPTKDVEDEDEDSNEERLYPLSYAVTRDQKNQILSAIQKAKSMGNFKTGAEIITSICDDFLSM
jgi:hypothetical protein